MKETIRLFVAATLPSELKEYLWNQLHLFDAPAVRPVPLQNLHLTLFFIGNVSADQPEEIKQKIRQVAQQHQPFPLELETLEPGPKPSSPRLVWARFRQSDAFEELSRQLTQELAQQPVSKQKAIPHVTLARFRKDKPAPKHLPVVVPEETVQLTVTTISLWKSDLSAPHPVYTVLDTFPLSEKPI